MTWPPADRSSSPEVAGVLLGAWRGRAVTSRCRSNDTPTGILDVCEGTADEDRRGSDASGAEPASPCTRAAGRRDRDDRVRARLPGGGHAAGCGVAGAGPGRVQDRGERAAAVPGGR